MSQDEFLKPTPGQKKILAGLASETGPVPNSKYKLDNKVREKLVGLEYLVVAGRPMTLLLTDAGRQYVDRLASGQESPPSDSSEFTSNQVLALLTLMGEARELTNAELAKLAGISLTGVDNTELEAAGLVETDRSRQTFSHRLTDKGWFAVRSLHEKEPPAKSGSAVRTIFTLMANVTRSLDRLQLGPGEFFKQGGEPARPATSVPAPRRGSGDVEADIRAAYHDLAVKPGNWVGLADLRDRLPGFDRPTVDTALRAMVRKPGIRIIPVANTKSLTARDREAALVIGDEDNHTISIGAA